MQRRTGQAGNFSSPQPGSKVPAPSTSSSSSGGGGGGSGFLSAPSTMSDASAKRNLFIGVLVTLLIFLFLSMSSSSSSSPPSTSTSSTSRQNQDESDDNNHHHGAKQKPFPMVPHLSQKKAHALFGAGRRIKRRHSTLVPAAQQNHQNVNNNNNNNNNNNQNEVVEDRQKTTKAVDEEEVTTAAAPILHKKEHDEVEKEKDSTSPPPATEEEIAATTTTATPPHPSAAPRQSDVACFDYRFSCGFRNFVVVSPEEKPGLTPPNCSYRSPKGRSLFTEKYSAASCIVPRLTGAPADENPLTAPQVARCFDLSEQFPLLGPAQVISSVTALRGASGGTKLACYTGASDMVCRFYASTYRWEPLLMDALSYAAVMMRRYRQIQYSNFVKLLKNFQSQLKRIQHMKSKKKKKKKKNLQTEEEAEEGGGDVKEKEKVKKETPKSAQIFQAPHIVGSTQYLIDDMRPMINLEMDPSELTDDNYGVEFIDIGMHVGTMTMLLWRLGFPVKGFEPMHTNINLLSATRCLNGLNTEMQSPQVCESAIFENADGSTGTSPDGRKEGGEEDTNIDACLAAQQKLGFTSKSPKERHEELLASSCPVAEGVPFQLSHVAIGAKSGEKCVMFSDQGNIGDVVVSCDKNLSQTADRLGPDEKLFVRDTWYTVRGHVTTRQIDDYVFPLAGSLRNKKNFCALRDAAGGVRFQHTSFRRRKEVLSALHFASSSTSTSTSKKLGEDLKKEDGEQEEEKKKNSPRNREAKAQEEQEEHRGEEEKKENEEHHEKEHHEKEDKEHHEKEDKEGEHHEKEGEGDHHDEKEQPGEHEAHEREEKEKEKEKEHHNNNNNHNKISNDRKRHKLLSEKELLKHYDHVDDHRKSNHHHHEDPHHHHHHHVNVGVGADEGDKEKHTLVHHLPHEKKNEAFSEFANLDMLEKFADWRLDDDSWRYRRIAKKEFAKGSEATFLHETEGTTLSGFFSSTSSSSEDDDDEKLKDLETQEMNLKKKIRKLIPGHGFFHKDYIVKIDVEGHEANVMKGAHRWLSHPVLKPRMLLVETWTHTNVTEFCATMYSYGYIAYSTRTQAWLLNSTDALSWHDDLRRRNEMHDDTAWIELKWAPVLMPSDAIRRLEKKMGKRLMPPVDDLE